MRGGPNFSLRGSRLMAHISTYRVVLATAGALTALLLAGCGTSSSPPPTVNPVGNSRLTYGPVAFATGARGMISASTAAHSYILATNDGGRTWSHSRVPVRIAQLAYPDPQHAYALVTSSACLPATGPNARLVALRSCRSGVMKSVDGGRTWTWKLQLSWPYEPLFFGFRKRGVGWVVLDRGQCLHVPKSLNNRKQKVWNCYRAGYKSSMVTTDGGATWKRVLSRVGGLDDLVFTSANTGWAITVPSRRQLARLAAHPHPGNNGCVSSLLYSNDGGRAWIRRRHMTSRCQATISFVSPSTGYMLLTRCQAPKCHQVVLLRTTDHGQIWRRVWRGGATSSTDPRAAITSVLFKTVSVGWLARADAGRPLQSGLMTSDTGGHGWAWHFKDTSGTSRPNMALPKASTGWVVMSVPGCHPVCSRVYRTKNGGNTWSLVNLPVP